MGIGNRRVERRAPVLPALPHYPSWGLETRRVVCRRNGGVRLLITPHGDWKPCRGARCYCSVARLITPHGDWKRRPTDLLGETCYAGSLPLMGIGNALPWQADCRPKKLSLPLMGIGNLCARPQRRSAGGLDSLPLMGIGNAWRLGWDHPERGAHYPSWGLETGAPRPALPPRGEQAHYPSWGLETSGVLAHPRRYYSHYPSWGLETVETDENATGRASFLITPHGDWKPLPHCHRPGGGPAHYPSWGLETPPFYRLNRYRRAVTAPPFALPDHRDCA